MKACGLIVEYNPFHNGHLYHVKEAKEKSAADCMIAVMSGTFLQRGEPAIIDKFHRAKAALKTGVDLVIELPYPYAVQSSHLFARGAVQSLFEIGVSQICFGSESGDMTPFLSHYDTLKKHDGPYQAHVRALLQKGLSYPQANALALKHIGLTDGRLDLSKPNNILGFSYVQTILDEQLPIEPMTIQRIKSEFHDQSISGDITSATSIRQALFAHDLSKETQKTMPPETIHQLREYAQTACTWHNWEKYFPLIHYLITIQSSEELSLYQGVDEGLEHRLKQTAKDAVSFKQWMTLLKTKRYTWTRLQRMFVHILTQTKKADIEMVETLTRVPYVRILGMTKTGRAYLNAYKKNLSVPLITQLTRDIHPVLAMEEKASDAYYSILAPRKRKQFKQQELNPLIRV